MIGQNFRRGQKFRLTPASAKIADCGRSPLTTPALQLRNHFCAL